MLRRQVRLRREYLHNKSQEQREREIWQRKQAVKDALAKGKDARSLGHGVGGGKDGRDAERTDRMDGAQEEPMSHVDDEYSTSGISDPKILITTSRNPSSKLLQFSKEIRLLLPNSHRINRGGYVMKELSDACRSNDITDLVIVHEHRGVPDALIISHFPYGPTLLVTLHSVQLRHDLPNYSESTVSEQYPHLIFEGFETKLGNRVMDILKNLWPVPREESKRTMTLHNEGDFISFRHHVFVKTSHKEVQLAEVGPRFEMRPYEIRQGTVEQKDADIEWVLRPYQRTARKRNQL